MADTILKEQKTEQVSLTLQIDADVYAAFLRKAQQADMDIESFLSSTLTIVLGCRVFNEKYSCSPASFANKTAAGSGRC
jgi:hypothetical protein